MVEGVTSGTIGLVSHSLAAAAYLLLAVLSLLNWERTRLGICLVAACLVTALWAASMALAALGMPLAAIVAVPLETLRSGAWILFLFVLLNRGGSEESAGWLVRWFAPALLAFMAVLLAAEVTDAVLNYRYGGLSLALPTISSHLLVAVGGLLLVENLFRNARPENRWAVKYLCLGLGGFFVYDLYLYANGLLFQELDPWVLQARGVANAVIVPLLAVSAARNPDWRVDLFVSRRLAFYSATLMASGAYLVVMALVGYYLREVGGNWGGVLQVAFLFGGGLLLVVILFSGRVRTRIRVFINKHFFNYRYDYREEWLRFINTMAGGDTGHGLRERAVQAVADLVESPGGLLLLDRGNGDFTVAATWNLSGGIRVVEPAGSPFLTFFQTRQWIFDINEAREDPEHYDNLTLPDWLDTIPEAWLVIPIVHHDRLIGLVVLQEARARHELNWEDHDILKTVGRQVASYVAEQESATALAEARQFEAFNRRFAFVLHDIKNLVSQLSLMTANAERHAGNPEFQRDMVMTVQESVDKMKAMLERLHGTAAAQNEERTEILGLLREVADRHEQAGTAVTLDAPAGELWVRGDRAQLATVFDHVLQNALEATRDAEAEAGNAPPQGPRLRVTDGATVTVAVSDEGPGMNADFIQNQLFKPFKTTKSGGYGIGVYESRQIVTEAGGRLDVESSPGAGTTVYISLKKERTPESRTNFELEEK